MVINQSTASSTRWRGNNSTVTVTDAAGYASNTLTLAPFTIEASGNITTTPVTTPTNTTSGATVYKFYNPLNLGSQNADVTALQERLTSEGVYSGPVTGYYGALTEAAVKKYQGLHGLSQLGNVGPATRALLNSGI